MPKVDLLMYLNEGIAPDADSVFFLSYKDEEADSLRESERYYPAGVSLFLEAKECRVWFQYSSDYEIKEDVNDKLVCKKINFLGRGRDYWVSLSRDRSCYEVISQTTERIDIFLKRSKDISHDNGGLGAFFKSGVFEDFVLTIFRREFIAENEKLANFEVKSNNHSSDKVPSELSECWIQFYQFMSSKEFDSLRTLILSSSGDSKIYINVRGLRGVYASDNIESPAKALLIGEGDISGFSELVENYPCLRTSVFFNGAWDDHSIAPAIQIITQKRYIGL